LYINDDYEGGILEFQKQNIQIQPKPGMLVCIPLGEDWTHRVTPVTNGVRHTLYGTCFANPNDREVSTSETC
jgi:predicted 2-oxoglutarate/Fe(II)-dependent dioxygenase YbiX